MKLDYQYSDEQLEKIKDQGLIYVCVCPRSLSDNRYECLIFCGAIMQKKQD